MTGDLGEFVGDKRWQAGRAGGGFGLGWSEADLANEIGEGFGDGDLSAQQVDSFPSQREELAESKPAVAGDEPSDG